MDINPNSVKICRLRLWIELLKNTYYKGGGELEVLPNIDINIKCGNSLISRFDIGTPISKALKKSKLKVQDYRDAVYGYKNAKNKAQKEKLENLIAEIKTNFQSKVESNDKRLLKLNKLKSELESLETQDTMFERSKAEEKAHKKEIKTKKAEIVKLENELEEIKSNKIYENAFEWRFEFPEVLADNGDFIGFDVVIGNPPYIQLQKDGGRLGSELERFNYQTFAKTGDIYTLFIERGNHILSQGGRISYIISNKWMRARYGQNTRLYLKNYMNTECLIEMGGVQIFDEATVDTNIIIAQKSEPRNITSVYTLDSNFKKNDDFKALVNSSLYKTESLNTSESWLISSPLEELIKTKIKSIGYPLGDTEKWNLNINRGVLTGLNEAFIIDGQTKEKLIKKDPKNNEILKPTLRGQDTKRYRAEFNNLWIISTFPSLNTNIDSYPSIKEYLEQFKPKINQTGEKFINNEGVISKSKKKQVINGLKPKTK